MSARTLPKALVAISLVSGSVVGVATATADTLPGTTGNTVNNLPGTTGNTTAPAPQPTEVPYTPVADTAPVPQAVSNYVPQVSQAAQPLQYAEPQVVYVQGEPIVVTETEYVDRQVVEEAGGLYILTDEGRQWITADKVFAAAAENYNDRDQGDKDRLNLAATAAALGATGGLLIGTGTGLLVGATAAGGAALALASLPVTVTAPVPVLGEVAATGAASAAIFAALAGGGAGAVAGGGLGTGLGADAAMNVSGTKPDVQEFIADIVFTLENGAREDAGYRGLVGDKPSGLPGYRDADAGSDTRITEGTMLGDGGARGQADADADVDAPAPAVDPAPALPQPFQAVNDAIDASQDFSAGVIDGAQDAMAAVVTGQDAMPALPNFGGFAGV